MKKYRSLLTFLAVGLASVLLVLPWWLRSGIIQEPLSTMWAAARLEMQAIDILPIGRDRNEWIFRTRVASAESPLTRRLLAVRWQYVDQMGTGWFYEKEGKQVVVTCRLYSPRYQICRAPMALE
ncbi:MAG: hypothetical protein R3E79_28600 [Caldilineaceae bacterium]